MLEEKENAEKVYNIRGSESLYTNSVYKKKFSTENKKSYNFTDLLRYCMYLISYGEPITLRKLKNHFSESTINYALGKKCLVPYDLKYAKNKEKYKNALFFTYYNYCVKNNIGTWRCRHEKGYYKNDVDDNKCKPELNSPEWWDKYASDKGYSDSFEAFSDYIDGKRK